MGATTKRIFYEEVIKLLKESGPMVMRDILPAIKERRPISTLKSMSSNRAGQLMRQCKDIEAVDNGEYIDIRVRRTAEHPKGEGWTGTGFRIPIDQALSLSKALEHILSERTE